MEYEKCPRRKPRTTEALHRGAKANLEARHLEQLTPLINTSADVFGLRAGMVVPKDMAGVKSYQDIASKVTTPSTHISKAILSVVKGLVKGPGAATSTSGGGGGAGAAASA